MEKQNETEKKEIKETQETQESNEVESGVSLATAADTTETEQQFREVHKNVFEYLFNTSLNLAADLLNKGEEPDERKLKELIKEILEEKIEIFEQYLKWFFKINFRWL